MTNHFSRALICAVALGAGMTAARAADLATKAGPLPPTPVFAWTGFYIGGHVGGGRLGDPNSRLAPEDPVFSGFLPQDFRPDGTGVLGGLQVGYNWQFASHWVLGAEADLSWTAIKASETDSVRAMRPLTATMGRDINWLASVRGRLGYGWDRLLVYGTGGAAFGRIGFDALAATTTALEWNGTHTETKSGWTVGGGIEYALPGSAWLLRGEYLYYEFAAESRGPVRPPLAGIAGGMTYDWDRTRIHVGRIGLSYQFGSPAVAARY